MPPRLILDTNVVVAGLRSIRGPSNALLQTVGGSYFTLGLTAALVLEYEDVLKRSGMVPVSPATVDDILGGFCHAGHHAAIKWQLRPAAADPGDDLVIEAAVATGSRFVVTFNTADMADGARRYGIELLTPAEAVRRLGVTR